MLKVAMQAAGCGNGAPAARSAWDASQTRESVRTCRGHERFTRATEGGQRAPAPEVRIRALKKGEGGRERMRGRERQKEKDRERERDRETVRGGESLLPDRARSYSAKGGAAACQLTVVQVRAGVRPSIAPGGARRWKRRRWGQAPIQDIPRSSEYPSCSCRSLLLCPRAIQLG
ncbi:unnamed protein product, partial [Prorocentrum cordatum]